MMLKRARDTNAFSASSTLSGEDNTYTEKVVSDTWWIKHVQVSNVAIGEQDSIEQPGSSLLF